MTPQELVEFAKRVHDTEGYQLGAGSSREYRNEFWARVVSYVHYGTTKYGNAADNRWYLKNGGPGRPQSDDVAVLMPERRAWDFIIGVGASGYRFQLGHEFILPPEQEIIKPVQIATGNAPVDPPVDPKPQEKDYSKQLEELKELVVKLASELNVVKGIAQDAKFESYNGAIRALEIKTLVENFPATENSAVTFPAYSGSVSLPGWLGGSRPITITPNED